MDITTVSVGRNTRDQIAEFRDQEGYQNYNEALQALLKDCIE